MAWRKGKGNSSSSYLKMRLDLNEKYQSQDFQDWLRKRFIVINLESIESLANKRTYECLTKFAESFQMSF